MRTPLRLAVVLAITVAVGLPSAALAGEDGDPDIHDTVLGTVGGVRYASDSHAYDPGSQYADATAGCGGPRWHMIGGGVASGGSASQAWLAASRGEDHLDADTLLDDGFRGAGFGPSGSEIRTFSVCIRDGELRYRTKPIPDQPSSLRSGSVRCGGARWHVTTGSVFIATSDSWAGSSYPIDGSDAGTTRDDGWAGTAYDTIGGIGGFYLFATCAAGVDLRYVTGASGSVPVGQALVKKAACPRGEHVIGGGVRISDAVDRARLVTSAPYDGSDADTIPDDGWTTRVYNVAGSAKQVTPFAICLS